MKRIMCYGDSLTWGWIPVIEGSPTRRYPYEDRWTGAMASHLGFRHFFSRLDIIIFFDFCKNVFYVYRLL